VPHGARDGAHFDLLASGPDVVLFCGGEGRVARDPYTFGGKEDEQAERDELRTANDDVLAQCFDQTR
jgi:hypothetical protein